MSQYLDVDAPYRKIYYARKGDLIKIGISRNPWNRTICQRAELLGVEDGGSVRDGFKHEHAAHQRWAHLEVRREWFKADPELMAHIATLECPPPPHKRRVRYA